MPLWFRSGNCILPLVTRMNLACIIPSGVSNLWSSGSAMSCSRLLVAHFSPLNLEIVIRNANTLFLLLNIDNKVARARAWVYSPHTWSLSSQTGVGPLSMSSLTTPPQYHACVSYWTILHRLAQSHLNLAMVLGLASH